MELQYLYSVFFIRMKPEKSVINCGICNPVSSKYG